MTLDLQQEIKQVRALVDTLASLHDEAAQVRMLLMVSVRRILSHGASEWFVADELGVGVGEVRRWAWRG